MNNPMMASEAYDGIAGNSLATECVYFVKGVVSQIGSSNDILSIISAFIDIPGLDSGGGVTYYISDDGSSAEGVKQLEVTSGRGLNNGELEAMRNICVGDEVIVVGQLSYSSSTPAFSTGKESESESEKTSKIDKGNYLHQYTPRFIAPDTVVYIGNKYNVNDLGAVNGECKLKKVPCEPSATVSPLTDSATKLPT